MRDICSHLFLKSLEDISENFSQSCSIVRMDKFLNFGKFQLNMASPGYPSRQVARTTDYVSTVCRPRFLCCLSQCLQTPQLNDYHCSTQFKIGSLLHPLKYSGFIVILTSDNKIQKSSIDINKKVFVFFFSFLKFSFNIIFSLDMYVFYFVNK